MQGKFFERKLLSLRFLTSYVVNAATYSRASCIRKMVCYNGVYKLLFRQDLAFTAKSVRKRIGAK